MIPIRKSEIRRYLGYGRQEADAQVEQMIDESIEALQAVASPKSITRAFPLEQGEAGALQFAGMAVQSRGLSYNLKCCDTVVLMAATLGIEVDRRIARETARNMARAVVFQATAAELMEGYCDAVNATVTAEYEAQGRFTRPRFSPGYGDFEITHQQDFARILQTPKTIGLTVTDTMMLVPIKSVTAVIGVSDVPRGSAQANKCSRCDMVQCGFREMEDE